MVASCCHQHLIHAYIHVSMQVIAIILIAVAAVAKGKSYITTIGILGGIVFTGVFLLMTTILGVIGTWQHKKSFLLIVGMVWHDMALIRNRAASSTTCLKIDLLARSLSLAYCSLPSTLFCWPSSSFCNSLSPWPLCQSPSRSSRSSSRMPGAHSQILTRYGLVWDSLLALINFFSILSV